MGDGGNGVGFSRQSDFVVIFHNPAFFDGFFDHREVLVFEGEESHMVRDLTLDGPDGALRCYRGEVGV